MGEVKMNNEMKWVAILFIGIALVGGAVGVVEMYTKHSCVIAAIEAKLPAADIEKTCRK
jgi:hypothetical protein